MLARTFIAFLQVPACYSRSEFLGSYKVEEQEENIKMKLTEDAIVFTIRNLWFQEFTNLQPYVKKSTRH